MEEDRATQWSPKICNERSGFLFSHECNEPPTQVCSVCGKPICSRHTHHLDNAPCCTSCVKQDKQQRQRSSRARQSRSYEDYGDPYFYGDRYYHGFGRYRRGYWGHGYYSSSLGGGVDGNDDFTAGDAESLMHQDDADFETDMSES